MKTLFVYTRSEWTSFPALLTIIYWIQNFHCSSFIYHMTRCILWIELWIILNSFSDFLHIWNFRTKNNYTNNHFPHFCILKIGKKTQYIIYDWKILTMITSYRKKYIIKLHNIRLIMKFMYNNNFIKFIMWYNKFVIIKSIEKSDVDITLCSSSHQSKRHVLSPQ